jgi:polysaccharide biosynthesis/export protein
MIGSRTLLEMLATAGGLQDKNTEKPGDVVHIIRNQSAPDICKALEAPSSWDNSQTIVVDLNRLLKDGANELNIPVKHGDVIHVPFAGNAFVLGGVRKPGSVPVKGRLTVSQAIASSGGLDTVLANNQVTVMRFDGQGRQQAIPVNLKRVFAQQEPDVLLKDQDVVVAGESPWRKALVIFRELIPGAATMGARAVPAP